MSFKIKDFLIPDYKVKEPKITVIERKLKREKADGIAWKDDGLIEVDPRQSARSYLETVIHESMHVMFPAMTEKQIIKHSKKLTKVLWEVGYRKVKL